MGFTIDDSFRVIDQDTRELITVDGRPLKFSSQHFVPVRNNEQVFDPVGQRKQMSIIFDYFISKLEEEGTQVDMYYDVGEQGDALEAKCGLETVTTISYNTDALKYVDMVMQLNGSDPSPIKKYDAKKKPSNNTRRKPKVDFTK